MWLGSLLLKFAKVLGPGKVRQGFFGQGSDLDAIIAEEGLNADAARTFIDSAFRDGAVPTGGTAITRVLPPVARFSAGGAHAAKKQAVLDRFGAFFERYFGMS